MTTSTRNKPCCPTCGQPMPAKSEEKLPPLETDECWLDVDWTSRYFTIAWCDPDHGPGHHLGEGRRKSRINLEKELRKNILQWRSAKTEEDKTDAWSSAGFHAVELAALDYEAKFRDRMIYSKDSQLLFETESKAKAAIKTIRANAMVLIRAILDEETS